MQRKLCRYLFHSWFVSTEKVATSEMFERETRREKILEAIELNREMQLRQKNKDGFLNLLTGKKQKYSLRDNNGDTDEEKVKVDPLVETEKEFYRILNEVLKITFEENQIEIFYLQVKESRRGKELRVSEDYDI